MNIENTSWVLKHAPRKIEDILLSEKNKEYFSSLKDIPNNMLFVGSPGSGKTTLAKVLAKKFAPESYMFLNASDESGIDVVRTKIKDFIETMSLDGNQKIVILDECLEENTLVWILRNGSELCVAIKDLNPETDLVESYDFNKQQSEFRPFVKYDKGYQELYEIIFDNNQIVHCTIDHKWYVNIDGKIQRKKLSYIMENNISEIISPFNSIK